MKKYLLVSDAYLNALLPSGWEFLARIMCMISMPTAFLQTLFWWSGITQKPHLTAMFAILGWVGFIGGLTAWCLLLRRRKRIVTALGGSVEHS